MSLPEMARLNEGDLDLMTVKQQDYIPFVYGRPDINKIKDNNIMGVSSEVLIRNSWQV